MSNHSGLKSAGGQKDGPRLERGAEPELRMILVGKTGAGKSATGNALLGQEKFPSVLGAKTTTKECQKEKGEWNGREFSLIDTPAIFDSKTPEKKRLREECKELSLPGPHALLLVTRVGRFTAEDNAAAERVRKVFGTEATEHTIVLFTRKEDLEEGLSLQEYVKRSDNKALLDLVQECGGRICAFNNRAAGAERDGQVSELMGLVLGMVEQNGWAYCKTGRRPWWKRKEAGQKDA